MTDEQALQIALVERAKLCEQERDELRARLLTAEHERDALRARILAVEQRQRAALGDLVKRNDRFIRAVAGRTVRNYGLPLSSFDDIAQEIRIGMMYAVGKFDSSHGVGFLSYASWWCRNYAARAALSVESTSPVVSRSNDPATLSAVRRLRAVPLHGATPDEIPLVDRLASDEPTPEDVAERRSVARNRRRILARVVAKLPECERDIAVARLRGRTYQDAGDAHGVTRSRAQQVGANLSELAQVAEAQQRAAERKAMR